MEEYRIMHMPVRPAAPLDVRMLEKAEALEKKHPRLVLAAETVAVLMGAAGLFSMFCGF